MRGAKRNTSTRAHQSPQPAAQHVCHSHGQSVSHPSVRSHAAAASRFLAEAHSLAQQKQVTQLPGSAQTARTHGEAHQWLGHPHLHPTLGKTAFLMIRTARIIHMSEQANKAPWAMATGSTHRSSTKRRKRAMPTDTKKHSAPLPQPLLLRTSSTSG